MLAYLCKVKARRWQGAAGGGERRTSRACGQGSSRVDAWEATVGSESTVDDRLMYRRELFIGGSWVPPAGGEHVDVISLSTEAPVGSAPLATNADIDRA